MLIYGKCYYPLVKLEHKAFWAIKFLNFNLKAVRGKRLPQSNELEEIHSHAYKSLKLYKEKMKSCMIGIFTKET